MMAYRLQMANAVRMSTSQADGYRNCSYPGHVPRWAIPCEPAWGGVGGVGPCSLQMRNVTIAKGFVPRN